MHVFVLCMYVEKWDCYVIGMCLFSFSLYCQNTFPKWLYQFALQLVEYLFHLLSVLIIS